MAPSWCLPWALSGDWACSVIMEGTGLGEAPGLRVKRVPTVGLLRVPKIATSICFASGSWNLSGCPPWGLGGVGWACFLGLPEASFP